MRLFACFLLCLPLCFMGAALAAVPQLSFDAGGRILLNPTDDDFVLRSANIDKVRLALYRVEDGQLLNQVTAGRATESITEDGITTRVESEGKRLLLADFILPAESTAAPQTVPVTAALGVLPPGLYMLTARQAGVPAVVQWFHITNIAAHVFSSEMGHLIMATHLNAAMPVAGAHLALLDTKGAVLKETPDDWRTDATGAVFWAGPWPEGAALLCAYDDNGNTVFLSVTAANKEPSRRAKNKGLSLQPAFDGNTVPSGATAVFNVALRDDAGQVLNETLRYEFARVTHTFRWSRDKEGFWRYQTMANPKVIERGTLRPARGGASTQLMLAVTEGRFRLTVTTPDGSARESFEFTAGWWRALPALPQTDLKLAASWKTPSQLMATVADQPETDAPRWAVVWLPEGPRMLAGNTPVLDTPATRLADKPALVALCAPTIDSKAVQCGGALLPPPPALAVKPQKR